MFSVDDIDTLVTRCRNLPPAIENYLVDDFVENMLLTVLDFQMHTTAVRKAHLHFKAERQASIGTFHELLAVLQQFPDDQEGNTQLALHLWGYKLWTRVAMLRRLLEFFESIDVVSQDGLREWAAKSSFERDFRGRVRGLGYAVYKWLVIRQGVETVKPDVHIRRFVEQTLGRTISDEDAVGVLEQVAHRLGLKAYELDWRIWEDARR
jgi:hypothetical protein